MPSQSDSSSYSMFSTGSNVLITGGSLVQNVQVDAANVLNPLYDRVSPNAILNAGGRADTVKCYPGTRKEVIGRIEKWHRADHPEGHPIFWLSGPAGAGKSAVVQTIAERCIEHEIPMVNFFFFRADPTRNHAQPVVATLLFQLFELFPALKTHVTDIVTSNPVVLRQSMQIQFSTLIEKPLRAIRQISGDAPPVVLIDGLDECSSENGKAEQTSLLRILHNISTKADPAFIILVASRTEAHLTMTFNEIGTSPDSIYLDESYRPFYDIRLFLSGEFSRIKRTHSLRHTLDKNWPLQADVASISHKSSGQFLYAATVMRFIAMSPASPKRSLEIVLGLRPVTKISPFATLDSLYTYILSQAEEWDVVHDTLAAHKIATTTSTSLSPTLSPLGWTLDDIISNFSELTAIVHFKLEDNQSGDLKLTVFHASLDDFLYDQSRAGQLYIDMNMFACRLAPLHFEQSNSFDHLDYAFRVLSFVTEPSDILDMFLKSYLPDPNAETFSDYDYLIMDPGVWINVLVELYQLRDPRLCEHIKNRWQKWFVILENAAEALHNNHAWLTS